MHYIATLIIGSLLLVSPTIAQVADPALRGGEATFEGLGDLDEGSFSSQANGVSADGSVVVGYSNSEDGNEAFRWEDGTMEGLGPLGEGTSFSSANGVSADGSVVVGRGHTDDGDNEAFRWEDGTMEGLGDLDGGTFYSEAHDVSADGSVVVGQGNSAVFEAFRWENGTMEGLGDIEGGPTSSIADGVSADGSVVVGRGFSADGFEAFRWEDGTMEALGDLDGGFFNSRAYGVSADGSVVVGEGASEEGSEAFRWEDGTMEALGDLDGGTFYSSATAVSADGSVVVGNGMSEEGINAFVWTEEDGMRSLKDILENDYDLDLTGWTLRVAKGISGDGTTIVGDGTNPDGNFEAWRAVLPVSAASVAGWQLLSVPGGGLAVDSLAGLNLVQGVEGSYPGAAPNLLVGYEGPTSDDYTAAAGVEDALDPGRGFFWYFFDADDFPGTPPPEFVDPSELELPVPFGTPAEEDVDVSFDTLPATEGGALPPFMIGNPFQAPFDVGGVSVDGGTLQTNFFTWDPQEESYLALTPGDSSGVWEGFWAEVDEATAPLVFTLDFESTLPLPEPPPPPPPPFEGSEASFSLSLELRGALDSGEHVADLATALRFEDDAMLGWDRHDGSKLLPPPVTTTYALLSPEGFRNGNLYRQSVRSLPGSLNEAVTVPVAFQATEPGSFEISAAVEAFPEGWEVTLRDLETDAETNLLDAGYAFASGTVESWQDRFEITVTPAGVVGTEDAPLAFRLSDPAPNPATESTALVLRVLEAQNVTARVYDALGRQVATIHDGTLAAGAETRLEINTTGLAAGSYVVRVEGESFVETRRVTIVR